MESGQVEGLCSLLPNETLLHIFSFLPDQNLAKLGLVCRVWAEVLNDNGMHFLFTWHQPFLQRSLAKVVQSALGCWKRIFGK